MFRYDYTQNASSPISSGAIAAGDVVGLNSDGEVTKYVGADVSGAPVGVAQSSAAEAGVVVEYSHGQVAMTFPAGADAGQIACIDAAGVVTAEDAPVGTYALGVILTSCLAGGKAVVDFDVDVIPAAGN